MMLVAAVLAAALAAPAVALPPKGLPRGPQNDIDIDALKEQILEAGEQLGSEFGNLDEMLSKAVNELEITDGTLDEFINSVDEALVSAADGAELPDVLPERGEKSRRRATDGRRRGKKKRTGGGAEQADTGADGEMVKQSGQTTGAQGQDGEEKPPKGSGNGADDEDDSSGADDSSGSNGSGSVTEPQRGARAASAKCKSDKSKYGSHSSEMMPEHECASGTADVVPFVCPMPPEVADMINCEDDRPESADEIHCITGRTDGEALLSDPAALQQAANEYWTAAQAVCEVNPDRAIFKEGALVEHMLAMDSEFQCAEEGGEPVPMCDGLPVDKEMTTAFEEMWNEVTNEDPYMKREYTHLACCLTGIPFDTMKTTMQSKDDMMAVTIKYWNAIRPSCG